MKNELYLVGSQFDPGLLQDVLAGLTAPTKSLPCKLFYDDRGAELFDRICELPEYYPTRTELGILHEILPELSLILGGGIQLVEYGSGSGLKTRLLLHALPDVVSYIPIDISAKYLEQSTRSLRSDFPALRIQPFLADYTKNFELPRLLSERMVRRVFFFPGSTLGNFHPSEALEFLRRTRRLAGSYGSMILGVDLKKPSSILEAAYNDRRGVTAQFNLNILSRLNRELGTHFDTTAFRHYAFYNEVLGRVEMHLVSTRDQTVEVMGHEVRFRKNETIHTENSYKYSVEEVHSMAMQAGFDPQQTWLDEREYFSVYHLM